jgi:hypothetical protein
MVGLLEQMLVGGPSSTVPTRISNPRLRVDIHGDFFHGHGSFKFGSYFPTLLPAALLCIIFGLGYSECVTFFLELSILKLLQIIRGDVVQDLIQTNIVNLHIANLQRVRREKAGFGHTTSYTSVTRSDLRRLEWKGLFRICPSRAAVFRVCRAHRARHHHRVIKGKFHRM